LSDKEIDHVVQYLSALKQRENELKTFLNAIDHIHRCDNVGRAVDELMRERGLEVLDSNNRALMYKALYSSINAFEERYEEELSKLGELKQVYLDEKISELDKEDVLNVCKLFV